MKTASWFAFLILFLAVACDSGGVKLRSEPASDVPDVPGADLASDPATDVPADATPDVRPDVLHDALVTPPWFPAKSIRLELAGRDKDVFLVNVVARSFDAVFGLALRLELDPQRIEFVDAVPEPLFGPEGPGAVYRAAQVRPGSLAVGMAYLGPQSERALKDDVKVATVKLRARVAEPSEIRFFDRRCLVVDRRLQKIETLYLGAILNP